MNSTEVKQRLRELGADLVGIASVERFTKAPVGFHPRDVLPDCRSVIVYAQQFLSSTLYAQTTVPYTIIRNMLSEQLEQIAARFCLELERQGWRCLPTGVIGPTEHDPRTDFRSRNIISAKHSAELAGLGRIGKNTLLITPEYGNMVWLAALVTELELEPDPLRPDYQPCPPGCRICIDHCPAGAIEGPELKQMDCWNYAFGGENGGEWKIKCFRCRSFCPACQGSENRQFGPPTIFKTTS